MSEPVRREPNQNDTDGIVVYFAGVTWDGVVGTDRQLVTALGRLRPVLWIDPPTSWWYRRKEGDHGATRISTPVPGVTRLHLVGPPAITRPLIRDVALHHVHRQVKTTLRRMGHRAEVVIASTPEPVLHLWRNDRVTRIYYATDDFVAGSHTMGLSAEYLARSIRANVQGSDVALAVSEDLARQLGRDGHAAAVLANGCDLAPYATLPSEPAADVTLEPPIAALVGQLNERLDVALLEAVAASGTSLLLVGPRAERDPTLKERLDALLAAPNVQWVGRQPYERLPAYFAHIDVGLTPYAMTPFNMASFPLKTLEYLAAGKPAVSSDIPATRALGSPDIEITGDPASFAAATARVAHLAPSRERETRRRARRRTQLGAASDPAERDHRRLVAPVRG